MYSTTNNNRDVKVLGPSGDPAFNIFPDDVFSPPKETDTVTVEYPTTEQEIYRYRQGGTAGTILKSIRVTYLDATKEALTSVEVL